MYPYIHFFGRSFPSYTLMAALGYAIVLLMLRQLCRNRNDVDHTQLIHLSLAAMGGLAIGAHLLYGLVHYRVVLIAYRDHFSQLHSIADYLQFVVTLFGGMVFYGGLFGAILGFKWYQHVVRLPTAPYLDLLALSIPLFHAFARIGCFLGGCCYGIKSSFGIIFTHLHPETANGVSRFPVQLLESGCNLLIFFLLLFLYHKGKMKNRLLDAYLFSYAVVRFFDEFLRGDDIRGFIGIFSVSQWISLIVLVFMIVLMFTRTHDEKDIRQ